MDAVAQEIPVVQQAKAVIRIATHALGVSPVGAISGLHQRLVVKLDLNPSGLTHPARDDPETALKGTRLGILQDSGWTPARAAPLA